eukprot:TRINITY_DN2676_c0_g1_i1.p2 TRINITY_DN2676_c0_g1~~TRINITY_DN2676_c0_g1_i1.p2  ORF type:complete len:68 (-),score=0.37 TRINITY_DN2676_c0_g1_i1:443-646(-)
MIFNYNIHSCTIEKILLKKSRPRLLFRVTFYKFLSALPVSLLPRVPMECIVTKRITYFNFSIDFMFT